MTNQVIATIVLGVVSIVITALIQAAGLGKMQGNFGARLDAHDKDIGDLKDEQDSQWGKINEHGERISHIEGSKIRPNGGVH